MVLMLYMQILNVILSNFIGKYLLPKIRDAAGQKGTGKWTAIAALNYGIPVTLIGEAVFSRCLSALVNERNIASKQLPGPSGAFKGNKKEFIEDLKQVIVNYLKIIVLNLTF